MRLLIVFLLLGIAWQHSLAENVDIPDNTKPDIKSVLTKLNPNVEVSQKLIENIDKMNKLIVKMNKKFAEYKKPTPQEREEERIKREKWTMATLRSNEQKWVSLDGWIKDFTVKYSALPERLSNIQKQLIELQNATSFHMYKKIGQKYYYIEKEKPQNWNESLATCNSLYGSLINLKNEKEWTAITGNLQANHSYWMEVPKISETTEETAAFINSQVSDPRKFKTLFENKDCRILHAQYNHTITAEICSVKSYFICEAKAKLIR